MKALHPLRKAVIGLSILGVAMGASVSLADEGLYVNGAGCSFVRVTIDGVMGWAPVYDLSEGTNCPAPGQEAASDKGDEPILIAKFSTEQEEIAPKHEEAQKDTSAEADQTPKIAPADLPEPADKIEPLIAPAPAEKPQESAQENAEMLYVQMALFSNPKNTSRAVKMLEAKGLPSLVQKLNSNGRELELLRAGPFTLAADANEALKHIKANGFADAYVLKR